MPHTWKTLLVKYGFREYVADFDQYAVCSVCSTVYERQFAVEETRTGCISKTYEHVRFPSHRQKRMHRPCGAKLMSKTQTSKGYVLRPVRVYSVFCGEQSVAIDEVQRTYFHSWWHYSWTPGIKSDVNPLWGSLWYLHTKTWSSWSGPRHGKCAVSKICRWYMGFCGPEWLSCLCFTHVQLWNSIFHH